MIKDLLRATALTLVFGVYTGCSYTFISFSSPPEPPCPIESLLFEVQFFPGKEWEEIGSRSSRGAPSSLGIERIGTTFSTPTQGGAIHHIYRFWDSKEAGHGFEELTNTWFSLVEGYTEWATPSELADLSPNVDQFLLECHIRINNQVERCQYTAQYESYVVEFSADMLALDYDDFIELVTEIDKRVASCLAQ
jgi:hypothetical protein